MTSFPQIKQFVQETLGCTCPEEVFKKIEYEDAIIEPDQKRICIGDRLLIYIISAEKPSGIEDIINTGLMLGVEERNQKGLNRFRLVLVSENPNQLTTEAQQVFNTSEYADDKTHLHLLTPGDIKNL